MSPKGQISIPKEARDDLGIKPGEDLVMIVGKRGLFLERSKNLLDSLDDRMEAWECMLASEHVLKKEWDNEEDEIWNNA
jgi:AbrB family looped-hinge helix DNA binding protein